MSEFGPSMPSKRRATKSERAARPVEDKPFSGDMEKLVEETVAHVLGNSRLSDRVSRSQEQGKAFVEEWLRDTEEYQAAREKEARTIETLKKEGELLDTITSRQGDHETLLARREEQAALNEDMAHRSADARTAGIKAKEKVSDNFERRAVIKESLEKAAAAHPREVGFDYGIEFYRRQIGEDVDLALRDVEALQGAIPAAEKKVVRQRVLESVLATQMNEVEERKMGRLEDDVKKDIDWVRDGIASVEHSLSKIAAEISSFETTGLAEAEQDEVLQERAKEALKDLSSKKGFFEGKEAYERRKFIAQGALGQVRNEVMPISLQNALERAWKMRSHSFEDRFSLPATLKRLSETRAKLSDAQFWQQSPRMVALCQEIDAFVAEAQPKVAHLEKEVESYTDSAQPDSKLAEIYRKIHEAVERMGK